MNQQTGSLASAQETDFLHTRPLVRQIASHRLGAAQLEDVEDVCQNVALRLWKRQRRGEGRTFSADEWRRYANTVTRNEVSRFRGARRTREISLSEVEEREEDYRFVAAVGSRPMIAGNTEAEAVSLAGFLWRTIAVFSLRQKYALLLQRHGFVFELIGREGCSVEDVAASLELSRDEFIKIIERLPSWSDEDVRKLLEAKTGASVTLDQLWTARAKAKIKLAARLKNFN